MQSQLTKCSIAAGKECFFEADRWLINRPHGSVSRRLGSAHELLSGMPISERCTMVVPLRLQPMIK